MTRSGLPVLSFLMVNYAPQWEAASRTIVGLKDALAGDFDARVLGFNTRGTLLRRDGPRSRYLPAPVLLAPRRVVRALIGDADIFHVFASGGERFLLPKVAGPRSVLSVAKGGSRLGRLERNIPNLRRFRYVIVESRRERDLLGQFGLDAGQVCLVYPGAHLRPYVPPPDGTPFTMAFATAPLSSGQLLSRGVHLMVRAAALLPEVRFIFAWRGADYRALLRLIADAGVTNIDVRNGLLDMEAIYASAHAVILPGLAHDSLKPCPQSLVESLAHGKPVLVTTPTHVSDVIAESGAGIVFEPRVPDLCAAIIELRDRYADIQSRCHATAASTFSPEVFLAKHRRLYADVCGTAG
ncbi:MAG TPA: glycosyltransferase family 4 protein [Longimicrobiales bacterium]|nr:glycosyltransferase family 4 protein [Longimicrobiales bacterium]